MYDLEGFKKDKAQKREFLDKFIYELDKLFWEITSRLEKYFYNGIEDATNARKIIALAGHDEFHKLIDKYYDLRIARSKLEDAVREYIKYI